MRRTAYIVCLLVYSASSPSWINAADASRDHAPRLAVESKLFFVDPGSLEANVALKVTIDSSPRTVFLHFSGQGTDKDDFILANLLMHAMHVEKGGHSTCTKRFEIDANDFRRIVKWRITEPEFMDADAVWQIKSLLVRAIPNSDDPSIGTLLFRGKCSLADMGEVPDRVAIQGLDSNGFERCHFMFDDYNCSSGDASSARRGRWVANGNSIDFDGFKHVFRPKDFLELPHVRTWRALPMTRDGNDPHGATTPWDGEEP